MNGKNPMIVMPINKFMTDELTDSEFELIDKYFKYLTTKNFYLLEDFDRLKKTKDNCYYVIRKLLRTLKTFTSLSSLSERKQFLSNVDDLIESYDNLVDESEYEPQLDKIIYKYGIYTPIVVKLKLTGEVMVERNKYATSKFNIIAKSNNIDKLKKKYDEFEKEYLKHTTNLMGISLPDFADSAAINSENNLTTSDEMLYAYMASSTTELSSVIGRMMMLKTIFMRPDVIIPFTDRQRIDKYLNKESFKTILYPTILLHEFGVPESISVEYVDTEGYSFNGIIEIEPTNISILPQTITAKSIENIQRKRKRSSNQKQIPREECSFWVRKIEQENCLLYLDYQKILEDFGTETVALIMNDLYYKMFGPYFIQHILPVFFITSQAQLSNVLMSQNKGVEIESRAINRCACSHEDCEDTSYNPFKIITLPSFLNTYFNNVVCVKSSENTILGLSVILFVLINSTMLSIVDRSVIVESDDITTYYNNILTNISKILNTTTASTNTSSTSATTGEENEEEGD